MQLHSCGAGVSRSAQVQGGQVQSGQDAHSTRRKIMSLQKWHVPKCIDWQTGYGQVYIHPKN